MSVLAVIMAIVGFFLSPIGMFATLLGLLGFFVLPIVSSATSLSGPARFYLWLAKQPLQRAAVVIDEHNGATFKQMEFDALGVENITLDGEEKSFEDPDDALHTWMGLPFALADEVSGVLFDPRHAALGMRKHDSDERDESTFEATTSEWQQYGVHKWQKAVFEMPTRYELVNLSRVRELVDGGERSEYPKRVQALYEHSRAPFNDGTPFTKYFYPIIGFAAMFFGIWFMSNQFGGGGLPDSSVGYGASLLGLMLTTSGIAEDVDWRRLAGIAALVLVPLGLVGVVAVVAGGVTALAAVFAVLLGFSVLPVLGILTSFSSLMAGAFSSLFFRLGFLGYQEPVFEWTPKEYRVRDYATLDTTGGTGEQVNWYHLFGTRVGFTYAPTPESWGPETMDTDELREYQKADTRVLTDGGNDGDTNLPSKYVRTDLQRDHTGGFLPKKLDDTAYYLHSGIATARFKFSAVGQKSLRRLLQAKEEEGENTGGMDDATVFKTTAGASLLGVILGVVFFVL